MKVQWILFCAIAGVAAALWVVMLAIIGLKLGGVDLQPSLPVWAGLVTATALATEGTLWAAAFAFGWSFLAKRRQAFARFRDRFFGAR